MHASRDQLPRSFNAYPMSPSELTSGQEWDALRREARKLETDLDVRLAAFGKLCSETDTAYGTAGSGSGFATDQLTNSKSAEINDLLKRLSHVNTRLSSIVSSGSDPRAPVLLRHRGVLEDYSHEYSRLSSTWGTALERAQLFQGGTAGRLSKADQDAEQHDNFARGSVARSNAAIGEVLGQANAVSSQLSSQRQLFSGLDSKMQSVSRKFPVLSGVMNAIRRKRSKDTIILSAVIFICTVFTILYWWSK